MDTMTKGKHKISRLLSIIASSLPICCLLSLALSQVSYDVDEVEVALGFFWLIKSK